MDPAIRRITSVATLTVASALIASTASSQPPPAGPPQAAPFNTLDLDQAWAASQQSGRPLLIFVSMTNCHHCKRMIRDTYSHPRIVQGMQNTLVSTMLMKSDRPDLVKKLAVRAYPTTLVISPQGDLLTRIEGYADPVKFVAEIRPALAAHAQSLRSGNAGPVASANEFQQNR